MMKTLLDRIISDRDAARKERADQTAIALLTTLAAEAMKVGKDAGNRLPTDQETQSVVRKFIKNAEQTLADLEKVGRDTSVQKREIDILNSYLPAALPRDEVVKLVREIMASSPDRVAQARERPGAAGWFVGQVVKASGGQADAKMVSEILKSELA